MPRLVAAVTLLLGLLLLVVVGRPGAGVALLASLIPIVQVEVFLLEILVHGVDDQDAWVVIFLLYGEDSGTKGSIFVSEEPLSLGGIFSTLRHRCWLLLHDFAPDFRWQKMDHEGHADLGQHIVVDLPIGGPPTARM